MAQRLSDQETEETSKTYGKPHARASCFVLAGYLCLSKSVDHFTTKLYSNHCTCHEVAWESVKCTQCNSSRKLGARVQQQRPSRWCRGEFETPVAHGSMPRQVLRTFVSKHAGSDHVEMDAPCIRGVAQVGCWWHGSSCEARRSCSARVYAITHYYLSDYFVH